MGAQSPNSIKKIQFRNVKVQCMMVVMIQKSKTVEAGTYFRVKS